ADAAGAVLADLHARYRGPVGAAPRSGHRIRQPAGLLLIESAPDDRHQQRGDLVVGNAAVDAAPDDAVDLGARQPSTVPLADDQIHHAHRAEYTGPCAVWRAPAGTDKSREDSLVRRRSRCTARHGIAHTHTPLHRGPRTRRPTRSRPRPQPGSRSSRARASGPPARAVPT